MDPPSPRSDSETKLYRVLVIDDSLTAQQMYARAFSDQQITTKCVSSGLEALAVVGEGFDCVVLDLHMPDMTGLEFVEVARERFEHLPPMVLSTIDATPQTIREARALGLELVLQKPRSLAKLRHAIEHIRHFLASEARR